MLGKLKTYFLISLTLSLLSCNRNVIYSKYITFENNEWSSKNKAVFDVDVTDVTNLNTISLMVRHADSYPYNNIFLFVTTKYPDGKTLSDTMELVLANNKGEWHGSGAGDIFDFKVPVKENVKFPQAGKYTFSFEQGMRIDPLPLVMDFGLEIKKSN